MFNFFRKTRTDLIKIYEYNVLIYGQKTCKIPMTKPRKIPKGNWSGKEMIQMVANRKEAQDLYDEIKAL